MFKALSRFGSSVRSTLSVGFISNIFNRKSKSRKYGGINDETEEIFSDAREELESDDEISDDSHKVVIESQLKLPSKLRPDSESTQTLNSGNDQLLDLVTADVTADGTDGKDAKSQNDDSVFDFEVSFTSNTEDNEKAVEKKKLSETKTEKVDDNSSSDSEAEYVDTDDHHKIHHDDTEQIVQASQTNGMPKSNSSSSIFKKVHRRVNSYTQRQYAKFGTPQEEPEDKETTKPVDGSTKDSLNNNEDNAITTCDKDDIQTDQSKDLLSVKTDNKTPPSPGGQNGITKSSSSSSMFKKMHRRVNSYTQRQYAKFGGPHDEETESIVPVADNGVDHNEDSSDDNDEPEQEITLDLTDGHLSPSKPKKKKKKVALFSFSFLRGFFRRGNKDRLE